MHDDRFPFWRQDFGDYLTELFLADLFDPDMADNRTFYLIGSAVPLSSRLGSVDP